MTDITVRTIFFDLEADIKQLNPVVLPDDPEMSYWMIGLSMILPYLEPYLVKHSLAGQKVVRDAETRNDMRQFSRQEAQHYKAHARFNDLVRQQYPQLKQLEDKVAADYARFSKRGLKFNLAFAEGFESLTHPFVIYMWKSGMIRDMQGPLGDMYKWHFLEEMEHRTVAYDAYYQLYDGYWYRLWVSLIAQTHLLTFMFKCAYVMLRSERHLFEKRGGWAGRMGRCWKWTVLAGKYLIPQLWKTYLINYNPRNLEVPREVSELADHYDKRAFKLEPAITV